MQGVKNFFENSNIFVTNIYLTFVRINFLYEYSRMFVYECVTVWTLVEYSNIFIYSYNFNANIHLDINLCQIFYTNIFKHLLVKYIWYKYIQIFVHVEIFTNITLWSRGPLGCTTHADITLYISQIPDTCIPSFLPLISPRYQQDITKISPIYPPKYIPQISPRYTSYIPQISKRYPKNISPRYLQRYDAEIEFWSLLKGAVVGYPERDVGKKKREQNCLGGILSTGFSLCICVSCSFNLLSFRNSLAQSLHVKFDCYFQSLKPEIVRLQPVILFNIFSTFKTIKSAIATLSPSFI